MRKAVIAGRMSFAMLVLVALGACQWAGETGVDPGLALTRFLHRTGVHEVAAASAPTGTPSTAAHEGLLYGRVTTEDGDVYEGRLRWGGDEEALWGNTFNGVKDHNPWVDQVPSERPAIEVFGIEIGGWGRQGDIVRPFMARFGDIARIEPRGRDIHVTLKSGSVFVLDRFAADDLADGVRVWDDRGVVDIGEWEIRTIELLPAPLSGFGPAPLRGTVRTRQGEFTGLVQWDRQECLGSDELVGRTADGEISVRFDTIRSITRHSGDSSLVTLLDGREIVLAGTGEVGTGNRGLYVDDSRYGRVLISWDAFERIDFSPGGTGPAYGDYPPGRQLTGSVLTRSGRRLGGQLVYDLDESESTETLDAPAQGVDYTIPFDRIAAIVLPGAEATGDRRASVSLHGGEELRLELAGDLGEHNAGMLVFVDGRQRPEYVPWTEVARIELDRPTGMRP